MQSVTFWLSRSMIYFYKTYVIRGRVIGGLSSICSFLSDEHDGDERVWVSVVFKVSIFLIFDLI